MVTIFTKDENFIYSKLKIDGNIMQVKYEYTPKDLNDRNVKLLRRIFRAIEAKEDLDIPVIISSDKPNLLGEKKGMIHFGKSEIMVFSWNEFGTVPQANLTNHRNIVQMWVKETLDHLACQNSDR